MGNPARGQAEKELKVHKNAKKWDDENKGQPIVNRPCDWCGNPVEKFGMYIHDECLKRESKFWYEIWYD